MDYMIEQYDFIIARCEACCRGIQNCERMCSNIEKAMLNFLRACESFQKYEKTPDFKK